MTSGQTIRGCLLDLQNAEFHIKFVKNQSVQTIDYDQVRAISLKNKQCRGWAPFGGKRIAVYLGIAIILTAVAYALAART